MSTPHNKAKSSAADKRRARLRTTTTAGYLQTMIEIAGERGVSARQLLEGTHITPALLETPDMRVSASEAAHVMANAVRLTGFRGMGMEFGLRARPTAHGYVGYAAMSCATLREALELIIRYVHLRQRDVGLRFHIENTAAEKNIAILEARDNYHLGPFRHLIHEAIMIGFFRMIGFLVGEKNFDCELWFDWPEPNYVAEFRARLPRLQFSKPGIQLRFPQTALTRRLVMADPGAVRQAVEHCERELAIASSGAKNLLERVRAELRPGTDGYPDLESVASCLFMSGRTLKRKLEERGTRFQQLLDEVRYRHALQLLDNPDLDIQQIAVALGYQDPPSFTRAFRRWSGRSPSAVRDLSVG